MAAKQIFLWFFWWLRFGSQQLLVLLRCCSHPLTVQKLTAQQSSHTLFETKLFFRCLTSSFQSIIMKFTSFAFLALAASANAFTQPASFGAARSFSTSLDVSKKDLEGAQTMIDKIIDDTNANPVFVRLAWHDSGTFDVNVEKEWPASGGAIGSIRFDPEINHGANAGLSGAVKLLEPVKESFPDVSFADIFQMASARSIELAGGPKIDMKYGRVDASGPENCSAEGNLPDAEPGPDGKYGGPGGSASTEDKTPNGHLRKVFYRMGLNDEEIVALSGAHSFGRAYKDRSGLGAEKTKFTDGSKQIRADGKEAKYNPGGSAWTKNWLVFDNSYFTTIPDESADPELLKLSTDKTLFGDEDFKPFAEKFRDSQDEFFASYAKAHKKLSELGSKFEAVE
jgi:L-ascorbate peroxidase